MDSSKLQPLAWNLDELFVPNGSRQIYTRLYIPDTGGRYPLVIWCHGLQDTWHRGIYYAESLAPLGVAVCLFDFCGGGTHVRSDGDPRDMSVLTEKSDLNAVLRTALTWSFVDTSRIVLMGASQGGTVAMLEAADEPELVRGTVLYYPGFNIPDYVHEAFHNKRENITDTFSIHGWIEVGRRYAEDMWDFDMYGAIRKYPREVLLLHGTADDIVDISYSERASAVLPKSRLCRLQGEGHGFDNPGKRTALRLILRYLKMQDVLSDEAAARAQNIIARSDKVPAQEK